MGLHWMGNLQLGIPMAGSNNDSNVKFHCRAQLRFSGQARCIVYFAVEIAGELCWELHWRVYYAFIAYAESTLHIWVVKSNETVRETQLFELLIKKVFDLWPDLQV